MGQTNAPQEGPGSAPEKRPNVVPENADVPVDPLKNKLNEQADKSEKAVNARREAEAEKNDVADLTSKQLDAVKPVAPTPEATSTTTSRPDTPPTVLDTLKNEAAAIKKDFVEGSRWTKAGYVAGGVVGFLAARWLWKKAFGNGENEGVVKKGFKWLIGLTAAGAGLIGVRALFKKADAISTIPGLKEVLKEAPKAAKDAVSGATAELAKTGSEAADVLSRDAQFFVDLFTNTEDVGDAMKFIMQEGLPLAYDNGAFVLHVGERAISLPIQATQKIASWISTGKMDEDFWVIYGASGASYFVGQKAFNLIMRGELKTLIPLTKKDIAFSAMKIAAGPAGAIADAVTTGVTAMTQEGRKALMLRYVKQSLPGKAANGFREIFWGADLKTGEGIVQAIEQWKQMQRDLEVMKQFSTGGMTMFSETEFKNMGGKLDGYARGIRDALKNVEITDETPSIVREAAKLTELGEIEFQKQLDTLRNREINAAKNADVENPVAKAPIEPDVPAAPKADATDASKAKEAAKVAKAEKQAGDQLELLLKDKKIVDALAETGKNVEDLQRLLAQELNAMDADTLIKLNRSTKAKNFLISGIRTGKAEEMTRMTKAISRASKFAVAVNVLGAGGDVFGLMVMWADLQANQERMMQTDNQELKELYAKADAMYYAEGATSAAGLFLGGIAIYQSAAAGGSLITALGAPAGMVMLPLALATYGARATYDSLEKSAEYQTMNERDLRARYNKGEILRHIADSTPLQNYTWSQGVFIEKQANREANEMARINGYGAYFSEIAERMVPRPTVMDLADLPATGTPVEITERRLDGMHRDAIRAFVQDAQVYINRVTGGTYTLVNGENLNRATEYALMRMQNRTAEGETIEAKDVADANYWPETDRMLQLRMNARFEATANTIKMLDADKESYEMQAANALLQLIEPELAEAEQALQNTSFSMISDDYMRAVARGALAWLLNMTVQDGIKRMRKNPNGPDATDVEVTVMEMKQRLKTNMKELALQLKEDGADQMKAELGTPNRLSITGLLDINKIYSLNAPTKLGANEANALPLKSIQYHYGTKVVNGKMLSMSLYDGASAGYLRVDERYWIISPDGKQTFVDSGSRTIQMKPGLHRFWRARHNRSDLGHSYVNTDRPDFELNVG